MTNNQYAINVISKLKKAHKNMDMIIPIWKLKDFVELKDS